MKDTTKTHCSNAELNVPNNAPLAVYQVTIAEHWLVMGLKTDSSSVDTRLSKMEVAIKNIASLTAASNLAVNKLIERKATTTVITVVAKNMCQVVSRPVETLADAPKQEERKLNLRLTGFEAIEGKIKNELVQ